jgi:F0F1-type ATP synthase assembly protein I
VPSNGDDDSQQRSSFRAMMAQAARYSDLAFIIPAGIFAGWLLGVGLKHWLHRDWLVMAGVVLGVIAGFVGMMRRVVQLSK